MEGEYRKSPKKTPSVTNTKSLNKIKRKKKEKSSLRTKIIICVINFFLQKYKRRCSTNRVILRQGGISRWIKPSVTL